MARMPLSQPSRDPSTAASPPRFDVNLERRPAMLVVAHPGHELRLHGWLSRARPVVHVLTDGSGSVGTSRIGSTTRVLTDAGVAHGGVYGAMTDAELYADILAGDARRFDPLVDFLADSLATFRPAYVVADAIEGYNPAHDLCSVLVAAAVARAMRRGRARPALYDYPVVGDPDECPARLRDSRIRLTLDDEAFRRKRAAAASYIELRPEVDASLAGAGAERYRTEFLRPVDLRREPGAPAEEPPYYERHGEGRVAEGRYRDVLRWQQHVRPFAQSIMERAAKAAR
jgi:hypothetical protein